MVTVCSVLSLKIEVMHIVDSFNPIFVVCLTNGFELNIKIRETAFSRKKAAKGIYRG